MKRLLVGLCLSIIFGGCNLPLTPEVIAALSKDTASFCAKTGIRGGAGMAPIGTPAPPVGGYGSAELEFCRSNFPNAKVTLAVDGSISIEHK